jgi:hypothetical protein
MAEDDSKAISIDAFLKIQEQTTFATVEAIENNTDLVKITPWLPAHGCLCNSAFSVRKEFVQSVTPTEQTHQCCGKILRVVSVAFAENATLSPRDLLAQRTADEPTTIPRTAGAITQMAAPMFPPQMSTTMFPAMSGYTSSLPIWSSASAAYTDLINC